MESIRVKLNGTAPIMFHNERLANPSNTYTRSIKALTKQRNKTDELFEQIKKLEWRAGFYDPDGLIAVPSDNVLGCFQNGAKKIKKGTDFNASVIAPVPYYALQFDAPKVSAATDIFDTLYGDGNTSFVDYRSVVVNRARTMRARPIFPEWSLEVWLQFDDEILSRTDLCQAIELAGERVGLCERRPRCGRFTVEFL